MPAGPTDSSVEKSGGAAGPLIADPDEEEAGDVLATAEGVDAPASGSSSPVVLHAAHRSRAAHNASGCAVLTK
jgi:hypothetical protein